MTGPKKVFIRTFGCQMNEYDSDKMADVLAAAEGFEQRPTARGRPHPLQHLLRAREGAGEGVRRPRPRRALKQDKPGLLIGVGGCVASQEGGEIVGARPYVDVVFGPQTLHRLPRCSPAPRDRRGRRSTSPSRDREVRPPAAGARRGRSAFVSIMEGCSKYCTFCVVPYTRGEEVSRPFEDVLARCATSRSRA
jgi:tRNA-2-methylthio-N6-dimethylallyladenosine synthase